MTDEKCPKCGDTGRYYACYDDLMDRRLTECEVCKARAKEHGDLTITKVCPTSDLGKPEHDHLFEKDGAKPSGISVSEELRGDPSKTTFAGKSGVEATWDAMNKDTAKPQGR